MSTKQAQISLMDLFKLGSQRGNKKSKLNPRLKKYVYGISSGLTLIDLAKTKDSIEEVEKFLEKIGSKKKQVLVVGTEKHLQPITVEFAGKLGSKGMPYVDNRWLGGTLTNWSTVKKTLKTLEKNEKIVGNEKFFNDLPRNEKLRLSRETDKLRSIFGGLKYLKSNRPGAVIVLDAAANHVTIKEAEAKGVPVIALANTSTQVTPDDLKYTIICNNNSTKLVEYITGRMVEAYNTGLKSSIEAVEKEENKKK